MSGYLAWSGQADQISPARARTTRLSLVQPGDISAAARRRAFAHATAAAGTKMRLKAWAAVGSVVALFGSAAVAMAWAFFAVPNTPLP